MHEDDFADVVGKEPIVLLFATPALCQSRVCGPVADITEQVKDERPDDAAFIMQEIYNDNSIDKGVRSQVKDYNLPSEPWLFVIGTDGKISTEIEGAFSEGELDAALDKVSADAPGRIYRLRGPAPALAGRPLAALLELRAPRLTGRDRLQPPQLRHEDLVRAALVPVVVVGATGPEHVLDDHVDVADADAAVAARAGVDLLRDAADQPGLVALGGDAEQ